MDVHPTASLARFVADLRYEEIPAPVRERVKDLVLDAVGCALAGHSGEETEQVARCARAIGGEGEATVIGGASLSLAGATLLNAYLITAVTVCDVYRPAHCHMTPEVVPPALAIAERDGRDGKQFLTAITAGLEVAARLGRCLDYPAFRGRGFHSPGVIGPFGGAASAGKLLGLDAQRQRDALGLAGSQSAGTFAAWGTPTVKFHQCRGALSGLLAALLAAQGFQAPEEVLAHPDGGIFNAYSSGSDPEGVVADLGGHWELENISLRLWPAATPLQVIITALLQVIDRHDVCPEAIDRVRVYVDPLVHNAHGGFARPEGTFQALLSVHFVTAVVLHERAAWLEQFGPSRYRNADLLRFAAERIEVVPDDAIPRASCRIQVHLRDGRSLSSSAAVARGDPLNRASRTELVEKFRRCAEGTLSATRAEQVIEALLHLEELDSLADFCRLTRASP